MRAIIEAGFAVTGRNERGDSVYLAPVGSPFVLRVSSHARTPKQRRNHGEVLVSLVLGRTVSRTELARRIAAALRDYAAASDRRRTSGVPASDRSAAQKAPDQDFLG